MEKDGWMSRRDESSRVESLGSKNMRKNRRYPSFLPALIINTRFPFFFFFFFLSQHRMVIFTALFFVYWISFLAIEFLALVNSRLVRSRNEEEVNFLINFIAGDAFVREIFHQKKSEFSSDYLTIDAVG